MENFTWTINTKVLFGANQENDFAKEIKNLATKVLVVTGKGAVKCTGIFDKVVNELLAEGIEVFEFEGVDPNPRNTSVVEGANICKENNVELILGIGGGSVIDCVKAMSLQAVTEEDVWTECYVNGRFIEGVTSLPVATVLTLAATGSEMNQGSVITNWETSQKYGYGRPDWRPKVSLLNPEFTYSVNKWQTAAGAVDILSHLFEQYFSNREDFVQSRYIEGLVSTILKYSLECLDNPENYDARAQFMWAGSLALNGIPAYGKKQTDWSCHQIEHELSAFYDITHGVGLGIVTPNWIKYVASDDNVWQFAQMARNCFDIVAEDDFVACDELVTKLIDWLKALGIPTNLAEMDINDEHFEEMAKDATRKGAFGCMKKLNEEDVYNILKTCL